MEREVKCCPHPKPLLTPLLCSPGWAPFFSGGIGLSSKAPFLGSPVIGGEAPLAHSSEETHWVMKGSLLSESLHPSKERADCAPAWLGQSRWMPSRRDSDEVGDSRQLTALGFAFSGELFIYTIPNT